MVCCVIYGIMGYACTDILCIVFGVYKLLAAHLALMAIILLYDYTMLLQLCTSGIPCKRMALALSCYIVIVL